MARVYSHECAIDRLPRSEIPWPQRALKRVRWVVIHRCSVRAASRGAQGDSLADTARFFMAEPFGWQSHPYHFQVDADGSVYQCNRLADITNGIRGLNAWSVHVKCTGNFMIEQPTHAQFHAAGALCSDLVRFFSQHGIAVRVRGHTELVPLRPKRCPGKHWPMPQFRKLVDRVARGDRNGILYEPVDADWFEA